MNQSLLWITISVDKTIYLLTPYIASYSLAPSKEPYFWQVLIQTDTLKIEKETNSLSSKIMTCLIPLFWPFPTWQALLNQSFYLICFTIIKNQVIDQNDASLFYIWWSCHTKVIIMDYRKCVVFVQISTNFKWIMSIYMFFW